MAVRTQGSLLIETPPYHRQPQSQPLVRENEVHDAWCTNEHGCCECCGHVRTAHDLAATPEAVAAFPFLFPLPQPALDSGHPFLPYLIDLLATGWRWWHSDRTPCSCCCCTSDSSVAHLSMCAAAVQHCSGSCDSDLAAVLAVAFQHTLSSLELPLR